MYTSGQALQQYQEIKFPEFKRFSIEDHKIIQDYIDAYASMSCEYNFANLFAWQKAYDMTWTIYQERLLIYDGISNCAFMPLGEDFSPDELAILSLNLKNRGLVPDFTLATQSYLKKFPDIEKYYVVKENRDHSEYIYDVKNLCELSGKKLQKKRNLISQFKRLYPDVQIHPIQGVFKQKALEFAKVLKARRDMVSKTLDYEMKAMEISFEFFESIGLEGLIITDKEKVVAFSVFSQLTKSCYDIHFEKAEIEYKGAAQMINQQTAKYLKDRCQYLNREQDLGIKGLRQAKLSYDPIQLITPVQLTFAPSN